MTVVLGQRVRAAADAAIEDLLSRKARFAGLGAFEQTHLRLDRDGFELNGFDVAPGAQRQAAGDDLQEAERDHRQPHRQVPGDEAVQDADGL